MNNEKKIELVWSIALMILGIISVIYGIVSIAEFTIPHTVKLVVATAQIIVGAVLIVTTVLKIRAKKCRKDKCRD